MEKISNCDALDQVLEDHIALGQYAQVQAFFNAIHARVVNMAEQNIFATLNPNDFPCGESLQFKSSVIAASCLSICVEYDEEGIKAITQEECLGGGCCHRDTEFCFDAEGRLVLGQT